MNVTVQFEDMSFTSLNAKRHLPVEISEDEARKLTEEAIAKGLVSEPFTAITGAYVSEDDKIDGDVDLKTFTCVRLSAEVEDADDIWNKQTPENLLKFVGEYLGKKTCAVRKRVTHEMEGNWEVADIESPTGEEAPPWTSTH